jgi:hypothetical protein
LQENLEQYKSEIFQGMNNSGLFKEFDDIASDELVNDYISKEIFERFHKWLNN